MATTDATAVPLTTPIISYATSSSSTTSTSTSSVSTNDNTNSNINDNSNSNNIIPSSSGAMATPTVPIMKVSIS